MSGLRGPSVVSVRIHIARSRCSVTLAVLVAWSVAAAAAAFCSPGWFRFLLVACLFAAAFREACFVNIGSSPT